PGIARGRSCCASNERVGRHAIRGNCTGAEDLTACRQDENSSFAAQTEPPGGNEMSIPKEVIQDLLPVYLAGEASPPTRAWLEAYLADHPELAEEVHRQRTESLPAERPSVPPDLEMRTFRGTRRTLTQLRWLFGLALGFSLMPLSFQFSFPPFRARL